jgi:hypothetical protein
MQVIERDLDVGLQGGSVYVGRAGVALTYLRLAQALRRCAVAPPADAGGITATPEARSGNGNIVTLLDAGRDTSIG